MYDDPAPPVRRPVQRVVAVPVVIFLDLVLQIVLDVLALGTERREGVDGPITDSGHQQTDLAVDGHEVAVLDDLGCHHNRKAGGYHCHRGDLAGRSFASKADAVLALGKKVPPNRPGSTKPSAPANTTDAPDQTITARPYSLDDGDTYILHVRAQGIDTPEKRQMCELADGSCYPCGKTAREALSDLIVKRDGAGQPVVDTRRGPQFHRLRMKVWTTGTYGRPVVTAYLPDGTDVHEAMVRQGWAVAYRRYLPETLRDAYLAAEAEAKEARRGIWRGKFVVPWKWRRGERLACERSGER